MGDWLGRSGDVKEGCVLACIPVYGCRYCCPPDWLTCGQISGCKYEGCESGSIPPGGGTDDCLIRDCDNVGSSLSTFACLRAADVLSMPHHAIKESVHPHRRGVQLINSQYSRGMISIHCSIPRTPLGDTMLTRNTSSFNSPRSLMHAWPVRANQQVMHCAQEV